MQNISTESIEEGATYIHLFSHTSTFPQTCRGCSIETKVGSTLSQADSAGADEHVNNSFPSEKDTSAMNSSDFEIV